MSETIVIKDGKIWALDRFAIQLPEKRFSRGVTIIMTAHGARQLTKAEAIAALRGASAESPR